MAAGDIVLVDDGHSQSAGASLSLNWSNGTLANPVKVVCVDKADDSPSTGAVVTTGAGNFTLTLTGNIRTEGMTWRTGRQLTLAGANAVQRHRGCTFDLDGAFNLSISWSLANSDGQVTEFYDCVFDVSNNSSSTNTPLRCASGRGCVVKVLGGVVTPGASTGAYIDLGIAILFSIEGVDLSAVANLLTLSGVGNHRVTIKRCEIHASYTLTITTNLLHGGFVLLEGSGAGTISVPALGLTELLEDHGSVKSSLSRYRMGGADDGEQANAHSWEMVSSAAASEQIAWLESPPLTRWVDAGDGQTVTVYVASGVTLQDDDCWIEVYSPNEIDSPSTTAQGRFQTTRLDFQGTPTNLATDGDSTWNGTGVGTKQKITVTINPAVAGPVVVRCCLAKASTTVFVDPKLDIG